MIFFFFLLYLSSQQKTQWSLFLKRKPEGLGSVTEKVLEGGQHTELGEEGLGSEQEHVWRLPRGVSFPAWHVLHPTDSVSPHQDVT